MEINSIPFFNQEDFYTLLQEPDTAIINGKKRQRSFYSDEKEESPLKEAINLNTLTSVKSQDMNQHFTHFEAETDPSRIKRTRRERETAGVFSSVSVEDGINVGAAGSHRRLWVKDRSKAWWEHCNSPNFPEEEFRKVFRMSKSTFDMICEELDSALDKKNTPLRPAIPVRQRVAVCIWRLATGKPLRRVSEHFGLGISTCHKLVLEVCSAIKTVLMPKFLQWPNESKLKENVKEFESITGIPKIGGSIYTTHIPIIAPKDNVTAYLNKKHTERNSKTSYSVTVQGVVDSKGIFTDICIGWPGSMTNEKILEQSALFQRAENRGDLKGVWLAGNSGYPLMNWVLVPYTHKNLTWTQHSFNENIEEAQRVSQQAFKRLKGRWNCLQKRTEGKLQDLPAVLGACCVLHNICEMRNEEMGEGLLGFDLFDDEIVPENNVRSVSSMQDRDHIAHNLLHFNLGSTSFR